jgi:hypothetical protein
MDLITRTMYPAKCGSVTFFFFDVSPGRAKSSRLNFSISSEDQGGTPCFGQQITKEGETSPNAARERAQQQTRNHGKDYGRSGRK